ncbi:venom protease-like [Frankliniella occidentalis]|uniref:CLIP domain-containing serine protease n=1 Tax=Frankliniella occidentalis TaxID=133901 RepID=A0A9C6XVS7_FRAOC|nr:venom protease-like [Frankliniella occidentalis]
MSRPAALLLLAVLGACGPAAQAVVSKKSTASPAANATPRPFEDLPEAGTKDLEPPSDCTTPANLPGNCQRIQSCHSLYLLMQQRLNSVQIDFLRRSQCGFEGRNPKVCCPQRGRAPSQSGNIPDWNRVAGFTPIPNEGFPKENFPTDFPASAPRSCGRQHSSTGLTRVVGGTAARNGEWPWIVALGYKTHPRSSFAGRPQFKCGGTLVSEKHVVTAGHCVYQKKTLYLARLGELDLEDDEDGAHPVDIEVAAKHVHPEYSPTRFTNDIAILTLRSAAPSTDGIEPACLPMRPDIRSLSFERYNPFTAGWGSTSFNGPSSSMLMQVQLPVVSVEECQRAFAGIKTATIDNRTLCAGLQKGGKDACQGDSGGPLVWPASDGTYYLIGVVSYGLRCAEAGYPGVYTRVTAFLDWMQDTMKL